MDRMTKSIAAAVVILVLFLGMNYAIDGDSTGASVFNMPNFNTTASEKAEDIPIRTLADFNNAIVNIADRTNPTVVTITTQRTVREQVRSPFDFFFQDPRQNRERERQVSGLGSGVIVDSGSGYIVTNNHVIENAEEINIRLFNGDEHQAEIVGTDPGSDVAVLKVDVPDLPAVPLGNSDNIRVGEMVLAIGSPLQERFAHTVSQGIVSASGRSFLGLNQFENYIQTDAAINPGNSGGALINLDGELIGINTAIASRSGGSQGIGFAIPVNMVKNVMEALIEDGRVARGFLGLNMGGEVDRTMARALGMSSPRGFIVGDITSGGPADKAGIRSGDVLVNLNGERIRDYHDFRVAIANSVPGTEVELEIFRDGENMTITVELGERDADDVAAVEPDEKEDLVERLGFEVDDLTDNLRQQLRLQPEVNGVIVSGISQRSSAYRQGLREGDVITQVGSQTVENENEFYSIMSDYAQSENDALLLRIIRQGNNMFIAFEL
ncbi:Do family serine endopeptidase [Rhodohalobacter sp. SW132]|uniref:Do family serine endopeptidase n=1 Tax=Rhodohalobacter sp. SW132 TaxID=2293433 RepID=UPI000E27C601|nr:Do family serine endopeptidase [Rhodohalobacter sp. SW132]REL33068.1 Do family serine endopeptidase [Rhodohalobacter sp. SW132]